MSMLPSLIATIGTILAVLITGIYTVILFNRRKDIEHHRVNKAIATEIYRLMNSVIPKHKDWWLRCIDSNDTDLPLIPFTTPIYDKLAKNIGMLDEEFVSKAVSFYGYITFLNALQQTREDHIKLNKLDIFVDTYKDTLIRAVIKFEITFVDVFKKYGLG